MHLIQPFRYSEDALTEYAKTWTCGSSGDEKRCLPEQEEKIAAIAEPNNGRLWPPAFRAPQHGRISLTAFGRLHFLPLGERECSIGMT